MSKVKFLICEHCKNIVEMIDDKGVPIMCCGKKMEELTANTVEASQEKHVPVVTITGDNIAVDVGSVDHPMLAEHAIQWIYLETEKGSQKKVLKAGDAPKVTFTVTDDKAIAVYEYCNLHGLWKTDLTNV